MTLTPAPGGRITQKRRGHARRGLFSPAAHFSAMEKAEPGVPMVAMGESRPVLESARKIETLCDTLFAT